MGKLKKKKIFLEWNGKMLNETYSILTENASILVIRTKSTLKDVFCEEIKLF